jgi:hypothetical protein
MRSVSHQRCFNHAGREAAARCPECGQFYCRECITEHEERVICAACLKKLAGVPFTQRGAFVGVLRVAQCAIGVLLIWWCFYFLGQSLLAIPGSFHDGTVWKRGWMDEE